MIGLSGSIRLLMAGLLAASVVACSSEREPRAEKEEGKEKVEIRVDESTIAAGDPMKVIEPVWWQATIYDGPAAYESSLARFSTPQRLVWAVLWYDAEVNNGGHDQFYSNSTGIVWQDALRGFEAIGVPEGAEILRESARRMGGSPSLDRETRNRQLQERSPDFGDLDERYYALNDRTNLQNALMTYIKGRPSEFYFSGVVERPVTPKGG